MSPDKIPKNQSRSNRTSFKALASGRRYSPAGRQSRTGDRGGREKKRDRKGAERQGEAKADRRTDGKRG